MIVGQKTFKVEKGTYILIFELKTLHRLSVGKLGRLTFSAGWYAYTGSAQGPGGLAARVHHHLRIAPHPHWHMDYLRPRGRIREVWYGQGEDYGEHQWAACLEMMPHAAVAAPGFGSSDCACRTHLIYFPTRPNIAVFKRRQPVKAGVTRPSIYRLTDESL